jgi:hypothetical protein
MRMIVLLDEESRLSRGSGLTARSHAAVLGTAAGAVRRRAVRDHRRGDRGGLGLAHGRPLARYARRPAALIAAGGLAVAVANSVVERRRSLASLTASGVPRGVLRRAVIWQTAAVAVPAITVAMATGVALSASIAHPTVTRGGSEFSCTAPDGDPDACMSADPRARGAVVVVAPKATLRVPVPWRDLLVIGGWGLGATVLTAGLGLVFIRASTAPEELRTT